MFRRTIALARRLMGRAVKITAIQDLFGGLFSIFTSGNLRDYSTYLAGGTRKIWALYRGCKLVADTVLDTAWIIKRKEGDGTPIKGSQVQKLLEVPNEFETGSELLFKTVFHLKLTGNAYWIKDGPNINGDRPKRIFTANPKRMQIIVKANQGITGYIYTNADGLQLPFDITEVMHFRLPHPDNDWMGLGDVEAAEDLFNEFMLHQAWHKEFWKNGARPSGALFFKGQFEDEAAFQKAKAKWQKDYGGSENAGKTAFVAGEADYKQMGLSMSDMQDVEQEKWTIEKIFHQLGVPLSVAGIRDAANYATSQIDNIRFKQYTIRPLIRFIEETINSDLVAGFDERLELVFQLSGLTDLSMLQFLTPLFDRGALTVGQLAEAGGQPMDAADPMFNQRFISAAYVPLEMAGLADQGQAAEAAQATINRFHEHLLQGNGEPRRI